MHEFRTTLNWTEEKKGTCSAEGKSSITVATPPEFGGPEGTWSPEELFVGSIASCLMSTFLYFVERMHIALHSYESSATGTMDKTPEGLCFTKVVVRITADVDEKYRKKTEGLKNKLEKYCPVSASVSCPVELVFEISSKA